MRFQNPIILTFSLCTLLMIAGCGKSKSGDAKPANPEGEHAGEHHGPHKGMLFDVGPDHKVLGEAVITTEPRKLELYLLDHNDTKKAIISTSKTITITSIKADGNPVADITLDMAPLSTDKDGSSRFVIEGDKLPKEITEDHDLIGAKFSVMIGGKEVQAEIAEH